MTVVPEGWLIAIGFAGSVLLGRETRVAVFMNGFDVHANRSYAALPASAEILVKPGSLTNAGETVVARWTP